MKRVLLWLTLGLLLACRAHPPSPTPTTQPTITHSTPTPQVLSEVEIPNPVGEVELMADWVSPEGADIQALLDTPGYGELLRNLSPAELSRRYQGEQLRFLLPPGKVKVGQTWPVPEQEAATFLKQFHPKVIASMNFDGSGAHAVLRAHSPQRLDILFRVHAQFEVADRLYFSPAEFAGRLVLERETGRVEHVSFVLPTDHSLNFAFELHTEQSQVGLGFIPLMSLLGGDAVKEHDWQEQISVEEARLKLGREFFTFLKIDWLDPEEAFERSAREGKPLFGVVIAGVPDDQSC